MSVVCRASSIIHRQKFALNENSLTLGPSEFKLHRNIAQVAHYRNSWNYFTPMRKMATRAKNRKLETRTPVPWSQFHNFIQTLKKLMVLTRPSTKTAPRTWYLLLDCSIKNIQHFISDTKKEIYDRQELNEPSSHGALESEADRCYHESTPI